MPHEHSLEALRVGVDADERLIVSEILGGVGDKPILTDDHDDVVRFEQEPVELAPVNCGSTPLRGYRREHLGARLLETRVLRLDRLDALASCAEVERGLA